MSIEQRLLELADETLRETRWKIEMRKIAEEVRMIEARIKRLEEAGDYLCAAAAFMGWHDKIEDWNKAKDGNP